jgi:hypothetical protein
MSSYEESCRDFALFGNPEQEHWDHEFNAQFDRFDGHRSLCTAGYDDPNCGDMEPYESEPAPEPSEPSEPLTHDDVPF